jgi:predicted SAM-dependent methyltransferase
MPTRPEGAVTAKELDDLLDINGRVRIYPSLELPNEYWAYLAKDSRGRIWVIDHDGKETNFDWNGFCYGLVTWHKHYVFVNYWHYYAYMLREGRHERLLP